MNMEENIRTALQTEASSVGTAPQLKSRILNKLDSPQARPFFKSRLVAGITAMLVLVPVTTYAGTQALQLFNKDGQQVFEYRQGAQDDSRSEQLHDKIWAAREQLQPGEGGMVYVAGGESLHYVSKPLTYTTPASLQEKIADYAEFPEQLKNYSFAEGSVYQEIGIDQHEENGSFEKMKAKAESMKTDVLLERIQLKQPIGSVHVRYGELEDCVIVMVSDYSKPVNGILYSSEYGQELKEKVSSAGRDVLYTTSVLEESGRTAQTLYWVEETVADKRLYQLRTTSPNITKQDLMSMVSIIKP